MSNNAITFLLVLVVTAALSSPRVTTNVQYEKSAVLISNDSEVLLVRFGKPIVEKGTDPTIRKAGSAYKYRRFDRAAMKETEGEGAVYEYTKELERDPKKRTIATLDLGSREWVVAEKIGVKWSRHTENSGWLYFHPEAVSVQLIDVEHYPSLPLSKVR